MAFLRYNNLCKEYPILDSITSEYVILGLSVTKEWRKCFKIFEDIKISCVPNAAAYNAIISAAFSHNEYATGWNLFQEMIGNYIPTYFFKFPVSTVNVRNIMHLEENI